MPNGYPIAMTMCGGIMNVAIWANNGGVARIDLENSTVLSSFTSQRLADGGAAAVVHRRYAVDGRELTVVDVLPVVP